MAGWHVYQQDVRRAVIAGVLDSAAASTIFLLASNIRTIATTHLALEQESEKEMSILSELMQAVVVTSCMLSMKESADVLASGKRRSHDHDSDRYRTSKRSCRPTTTKYLPTPSPPPSTQSLKSSSTITKPSHSDQPPAPDPVRQYFLTHLSSPYPTPSEKEKLCKKAKITRRKLESDLTNWRRRSDWTDIMNTYCGGDKSAMRTMISAIERGEERDEELLARFGRMKAYLEKRDEQAGEWVYQVCPQKRGACAEVSSSHLHCGAMGMAI